MTAKSARANKEEARLLQCADQSFLGMLALELLEGRRLFLAQPDGAENLQLEGRHVSIRQCRRGHGRSPPHQFARHRIACLVPALPA